MRLLITAAAAAAVVVSLAFAGCGDDKKSAGEPCTATPEGATECQSGVCLKDIDCTTKIIPTACSGPPCDPGGATHNCGEGMQCAPVSQTTLGYCLPVTVCQ